MFKNQRNSLSAAGKLNPSSLHALKLRFGQRLANATGKSLPEAMAALV